MPESLLSRARTIAGVLSVCVALSLGLSGCIASDGAANPDSGDTSTDVAAELTWPRFVTESELRALGAANGPVYWAGPQDEVQYELTVSDTGTFYVRYLPEGTELGDPADNFLTVATYPNVNGYDNLVLAGARDGAQTFETVGGALIVTTPEAPRSTYFGFEGLGFQVEVFAPEDGRSLTLVQDGTVEILK